MDKDKTEATDYLDRQDFSEKEIENLHAGRPEYKDPEEQYA